RTARLALAAFGLLAFGATVVTAFRPATALLGLLFFFLSFSPRNFHWGRRRGCAFDTHLQGGVYVVVPTQFDILISQRTNRVLQMNFPLIQRNLELCLELVCNHARGNRAEHLAVLTGLHRDQADEFRDALGQLRHGVKLMGLALSAALAEHLDAPFISAGQM